MTEARDPGLRQILSDFTTAVRAQAAAWRRCLDCGAESMDRRCEACRANRRRIRNAISSAGIPVGYEVTLDSEQLVARVGNRAGIVRARDWRGGARLVFVGPTGTGKTTLAVAVLRARIEQDGTIRTARFVSAQALAYASCHTEHWRRSELEEDAIRANLVLLDGVGEEGPGRQDHDVVRRVVGLRDLDGRPTIITTALGAVTLVNFYGESTARRMMLGDDACVVKLSRAVAADSWEQRGPASEDDR